MNQAGKILDLRWALLLHSSCSANLAPNVFHLFPYLQNALNDKKRSQEDQVKTFVEKFLSLKQA